MTVAGQPAPTRWPRPFARAQAPRWRGTLSLGVQACFAWLGSYRQCATLACTAPTERALLAHQPHLTHRFASLFDMVEVGGKGWAASLRQKGEARHSERYRERCSDSTAQNGPPVVMNPAHYGSSTQCGFGPWSETSYQWREDQVPWHLPRRGEAAPQGGSSIQRGEPPAARRAWVNQELQFRSVADEVQHLQARLCALAAAVAELPAVFQSSMGEVAAEQERLHADLLQWRQQMREHNAEMREHKVEVAAMLVDVRRACGADVEAERARTGERVAALEAQLEAAVAGQQRLRREAVESEQQRRREATAVQQKMDALARSLRVVSEHSSLSVSSE